MHHIKHLVINQLPFIAIICLLLLSACEKVIDVDLNSASPKYVIEGTVTNGPFPPQVRITQTKNFDENNNFEGVDFAEVTISDDAGNSSMLSYSGDGIYQTFELEGIPGRTYSLLVDIGGETFTAESTMPAPASFDSLYVEEFSTFGPPIKITTALYTDIPGIKNYYRYVLYVNHTKVQSIFIGTDDGYDGQRIERALPYFRENEDERIKAGDTISVEMQFIEEDVYDYFFSLDQTISQDAASPANPISNISGDALGYFSAHSAQRKTIVVEEE